MSGIRHTAEAPTDARRLGAGEGVDRHVHGDHQLLLATGGVLEVFVAQGVWFTPASHAIWVPAGTPHSWRVHGTTTVHMVGIPAGRRVPSRDVPVLVAATPLVRELTIACAASVDAGSAAHRRMVAVLLDQLRPVDQAASMLPVLVDDRLRAVQREVEADLSAPLGLPELGRRVGASERTLSRLFHDELGMGFTSWRTQVRLHHATHLLAEGRSVTRTAADCGFSSPSAFVATFRAAYGQTPGALYRA